MNITYSQNGDYRIPNIVIRKTKPIGYYGILRKEYLEMHHPILFNELVLSDKLFEHCTEIDEAAQKRMELIMRSLAKQNGVTEQLKAEKPNGMGTANERLQGTGRGSCESGIDLLLREEVRAESCSDFSHIFQSCNRIVTSLWHNLNA